MHKSNLTGGKSHKRYKKHRVVDDTIKTELLLRGKNQVYAVVKNKSGGSRLAVLCSDDVMRSAIIPGKFYKKVWFNEYDLLLCELNTGGKDEQCYITHKYTNKDAMRLKTLGHITFECISNGTGQEEELEETKKDINDMFPPSSEEEEEEPILNNINHKNNSEDSIEDSSESIDIHKL